MSILVPASNSLFQIIAQTTLQDGFKKGFEISSKHLACIQNYGETMKNDMSVVTITNSGFDVNMDDMIPEKHYVFSFQDSKYEIWKNILGELVLKEL